MVDKKNKSEKNLTNVSDECILNDKPCKKKEVRPKKVRLSNIKLALQAKRKLDKKNKKVQKLTRSLARVKKEVTERRKSSYFKCFNRIRNKSIT